MKPLLFSLLSVFFSSGIAQTTILPTFDGKMDTSELSLTESLKQKGSTAEDVLTPAAARIHPESAAIVPKIVSHMPIIAPKEDVDKNMPVVRPDPSIDYKIIVVEPSLESKGEVKTSEADERLTKLHESREAQVREREKAQMRERIELQRRLYEIRRRTQRDGGPRK